MTDPTPTTEAGRAHLDRFFTFDEDEEREEATRDVLAIEAEARTEGLDVARSRWFFLGADGTTQEFSSEEAMRAILAGETE